MGSKCDLRKQLKELRKDRESIACLGDKRKEFISCSKRFDVTLVFSFSFQFFFLFFKDQERSLSVHSTFHETCPVESRLCRLYTSNAEPTDSKRAHESTTNFEKRTTTGKYSAS